MKLRYRAAHILNTSTSNGHNRCRALVATRGPARAAPILARYALRDSIRRGVAAPPIHGSIRVHALEQYGRGRYRVTLEYRRYLAYLDPF